MSTISHLASSRALFSTAAVLATSHEGRVLIEGFEGLRLVAYRHPGDVWTIGYGHTAGAGAPSVYSGMRITQTKADAILSTDLKVFEAAVAKAIKRPVSQHQFDACVSLAYNIGGARFATSSVVRCINDGNFAAAASAFLLWTKAGGVVVTGLLNRRRAEAAMFSNDNAKALRLALSNAEPMPAIIDDEAPALAA